MAIAKSIVSNSSGDPIKRTAMRLLSLPSDAVIMKGIAGGGKMFSVTTHPKGCMLGVSFMNCLARRGSLRLATNGPDIGVKAIALPASTVVLNRTIVMTRTPRMAVSRSAVNCGTSTCHAPRKTVLRRLIGGLPKTRVSRSKGVGVGNGRVGGLVMSNGRFFNNSIGANLGGLPISVIRGLGACSGGSSLTHVANVSSNRRRAILSLAIGGKVGRN